MQPILWTDKRIEILKAGWGVKPTSLICQETNASNSSVHGMARRLGLPKKRDFWIGAKPSKLEELWKAGVSASRIAAELGCTRNAVMGRLNRVGLLRNGGLPARITRVKTPRAPRPAKIIPPEITDQEIPVEQRVSLLELTRDTCRWPVGDPQEEGFFFCGAKPEKSGPYCPAHRARGTIQEGNYGETMSPLRPKDASTSNGHTHAAETGGVIRPRLEGGEAGGNGSSSTLSVGHNLQI